MMSSEAKRRTLPLAVRVVVLLGATWPPPLALVVWWAHWSAGQFAVAWIVVQMVFVLAVVIGWGWLVVNVSFRWLVWGRRMTR
jgi:hypothetical protein